MDCILLSLYPPMNKSFIMIYSSFLNLPEEIHYESSILPEAFYRINIQPVLFHLDDELLYDLILNDEYQIVLINTYLTSHYTQYAIMENLLTMENLAPFLFFL